jgi:hypothetical protein
LYSLQPAARIYNNIANNYSNWGLSNDNFVYKKRYLILIGGYAYKNIIMNKTLYKNMSHNNKFSNKVFIYDTILNQCYETDNIFCSINVPSYVIKEDKIYLIGGESPKYILENEQFGRHSDVFAIGTISEVQISHY